MPVRSTNAPAIHALTHRTASSFLNAARHALSKRESAANTILPYALERLPHEQANQDIPYDGEMQISTRLRRTSQAQSSAPCVLPEGANIDSPNTSLWLTCWSTQEGQTPKLDLVLSCTDSSFGPHPIFLWSSLVPSLITREYLDPRMTTLVKCLSETVPVTRVFSVFGPTSLTKNFSRHWSQIAGVTPVIEPLYAAKLLHATSETLTGPSAMPPGDCVRQAIPQDTMDIGQLCKEFSETSIYYPLSFEGGVREATELIRHHHTWVYETDQGRIASIVAATRISPNVATITKVYTSIPWRKKGYAERLVRKVTGEMLHSLGKQRVELYVGNGNAAAKVYDRVGFVGLQGPDCTDVGEEWLEVGFRDISLGHW